MIFILLFIGIAISSLYILPSGLPQPADFVLIFFAVSVYIYSFFKKESPTTALPLSWLLLVLWIIVSVLVWSIVLSSTDLFINVLFWTYNFLIASSLVYYLTNFPKKIKLFQLAIQLALFVSSIGVVYSFGTSFRIAGFFNNPNQLAFYSLCGLAINQVMNRGFIKLDLMNAIAFFSGILGIFAAASLGAMSAFVFLLLAHFSASNTLKKLFKTIAGVFVLFSVFYVIENPVKTMLFEIVEIRLMRADTKFDNIAGDRGYDRILAFPKYLILGAGEGHYYRFYPFPENEIHSNIGNLLFSYGLPGLLLYFILLYRLLRVTPMPIWLILLAPQIYSITHMGLRTTVFWLLLAITWMIYKKRKKQ